MDDGDARQTAFYGGRSTNIGGRAYLPVLVGYLSWDKEKAMSEDKDPCVPCAGEEPMTNDFITSLRALAEKHPRTVRSAARMRQPLDGADAQALEGALTMTEIERNEARAEVERLRAENEMLRADAMRYRWLRAQPKLRLESDEFQSYWIREDGSKFHSSHRLSAKDTRYGIYETLDETIDRAIKVDGKEFI